MAIVTFDYTAWSTLYPALAAVTPQAQAEGFFTQATLFLDNTGQSPVRDLTQRSALFDLLVAHIATLTNGVNGSGASLLAGPVTSAAEGSVRLGSKGYDLPANAAYFSSTPYGLAFWQATAPYRTMRYIPALQAGWTPPPHRLY